jgi:aspartyl-tRNA(Asn)/glutamyl-tRNA(Gln) amidotransferase subunit A
MQLIGRQFDERTIVKTAWAFQQHTDFHKKRPILKKEAVK